MGQEGEGIERTENLQWAYKVRSGPRAWKKWRTATETLNMRTEKLRTELGVWDIYLDSTWTYWMTKVNTESIIRCGEITNTRHRVKTGVYRKIFEQKGRKEPTIPNPTSITATAKPSEIHVGRETCHPNVRRKKEEKNNNTSSWKE